MPSLRSSGPLAALLLALVATAPLVAPAATSDPQADFAAAATAVADGALWAFGGEGPDGRLDTIRRYDPATGAWTTMAARLPQPLAYGAAVWADGVFYIFGGVGPDGESNAILRYDPAADALLTMPTRMAFPARDMAAAWHGGSAYVFGGRTGIAYIGNIFRYDPEAGTWRQAPGAPYEGRGGGVAVSFGEHVYVFGGCDYRCDEVYRFHPPTGAFVRLGTLDRDRDRGAAAWHDGVNIFLAGGLDGRTALGTVVKWEVARSRDVTLDVALPSARSYVAAVFDGAEAHVVGGFGCGGRCAEVARVRLEPGAPSVVAAPYGTERVLVAWTAPSSATYSALTGYRVWRAGPDGVEALAAETTFTNWVDERASPGVWRYRVAAVDRGVVEGARSDVALGVSAGAAFADAAALVAAAGEGSHAYLADGTTEGCAGAAAVALVVDAGTGAASLLGAGPCAVPPADFGPAACRTEGGAVACDALQPTGARATLALGADGALAYRYAWAHGAVDAVDGTLARSCAGGACGGS